MEMDDFLDLLKEVKKTDQGWMALCPSHDDNFPSLSISEGMDGRIMVKCLAGCKTRDIVNALGINMSSLYDVQKHRELEVWQVCKELAQSNDILGKVYEEVQSIGVTGEERNVKLLYLTMVSRLLDKPVSAAIKGASSTGKSYIMDAVVKLFPTDAYHPITAMSDRALPYTEDDLRHRMILIAEVSGIASNFQHYMIRTLLSEGRIVYETVEKTKYGHRTRKIKKEGPTGLICTTTAINLNSENETRMLSLTVNETKKQTKAIMLSTAKHHDRQDKDLGKWIALQKWLSMQTNKVKIPYAIKLAEEIPPEAVRLRRDFTTLLNLIKANAILHQANRKRNEKDEIVADIDDYRIVRYLTSDIISEGIEAAVSEDVRNIVAAVKELTKEKPFATSRDIVKILNIDAQVAKRRLKKAIDLNYLTNENLGHGKGAKYVVGDPLPDDIIILPKPGIIYKSLTAD